MSPLNGVGYVLTLTSYSCASMIYHWMVSPRWCSPGCVDPSILAVPEAQSGKFVSCKQELGHAILMPPT